MGYRRFIAYVYEYRKGKKEDNCGFMKVEVRNHMCTIEPHLQVGNLAAGEVCKVYGFVRKEGLMNGILLGSCKTEANRIECLVETDGMDMGGSGISLEKMGGMILLTESGDFFGTEWDDQTIRPENFKESIIKKEETGTVCEIIKEKAEEKLENESKPETDSTPDLDDRHEVEDVVEQMQDDLLEAEEMISDEPQAKDEPTVGEIWEAEQKITCRVNTKQEEKEKTIALPFGQPFCPFQDSDLNQCWKITPQDLVHFPRRQCALRNNRFLQYGYYNFGHLLLCHRSNGRYILGVPGSYDQQEQFMAGMFGFSCFKESNCIKVKKGRGGYWYRAIDPPAGC